MKFFTPILLPALVAGANPIRRVVNMLQAMQDKVVQEGREEEDLYEKFHCYCKKNTETLSESISSAQARSAQLDAQVKEDSAAKTVLDEELKNFKDGRAEAENAVAGAKKQRAKEKATFDKDSSDTHTNILALGKAIDALEKGLGGAALLQTQAGSLLRNLVQTSKNLSNLQRQGMVAFLTDQETAPGSNQIVGILKAMKDEMEKDLKEMKSSENTAIMQFEDLIRAKKKEIAAATKNIEVKSQRFGELAVKIVEGKNDLAETIDALSEDEKFKFHLIKDCEAKQRDMENRRATRSEEVTALAETIKVLNDDDALDLFNSVLPKPRRTSFLQQVVTKKQVQDKAARIVALANKKYKHVNLDLVVMKLKSSKVDFTTVVKMIDEMVELLKKEQATDDQHKEYCEKEFDTADDKKRATQRDIQDLTHTREQADNARDNFEKEIKDLKDGIAALDKSVAEATKQREEEHAEFVKSSSNNQAAVDLIAFAKNRMNKFYNPKQYVPPPPRELTEEERVYNALGGDVPTAAPTGIAGTGIGVATFLQFRRGAPPPPPETFGAYSKKSGESTGVIAMMDMLSNDVKKDQQVSEVNEKDAQEEYQQLMNDSQQKRMADSKSLTQKEGAKADAVALIEQSNDGLISATQELKAIKELIGNLHKGCDFLLENYDYRQKARGGEIDALKEARAVLNGADYA